MAFRAIPCLPSVLDSSSGCTAWLQRAAGPAATWAADGVRRGLSAVRAEEQPVTPQPSGLPPPWEPPPHNPRSLKPKPPPTMPEILARIQQAPTVAELHNAYRRKSGCLPPPVAAAMYTRLSQLLTAPTAARIRAANRHAATNSSSISSCGSSSSSGRGQRGQMALLGEVRKSWDVFLQLMSARNLAALIRASGEVGGLAQPPVNGAAAAEEPAVDDLVRRSLDVLLGGGGRELAEAGPQAVLDVSYGLMLAGHDESATWRTLGPMLRSAQSQLQQLQRDGTATAAGGAGAGAIVRQAPEQLAAKVLTWLQQKGLPTQ